MIYGLNILSLHDYLLFIYNHRPMFIYIMYPHPLVVYTSD